MRIHLLAVPHTITRDDFSGCAFTGKVQRFAPMLRPLGFEVIHYGVAGAQSGANAQVDVMTEAEQVELLGHRHFESATRHFGNDTSAARLYETFNERVRRELLQRVTPDDVVALPFGRSHQAALEDVPGFHVETGIGYRHPFARFRIYESQAWLHWNRGREHLDSIEGSDYEWVVPNSYRVNDWSLGSGAGGYVLFFGRLNADKGLEIFLEAARHRPDLEFVLCGYGDPSHWLVLPNVRHLPPVSGTARDALLGNAAVVMMPTRYIEPFGGVTVEANLCGTPVLGSAYGSFTETIQHGVTGYRCRTLGDWLAGLEQAMHLDRARVREEAARRYSLETVGPLYAEAFQQIADLNGEGWYSKRSTLGPVTRAAISPPPLRPELQPVLPQGLTWDERLPEKTVALTFDDGPHPVTTSEILDVLHRQGVRATFFVMGENVRRFPEIVLRAAREGHEIGNHSDEHLRYPDLDASEVAAQVDGCEAALTQIGLRGDSPRVLRPPFGQLSQTATDVIASKGHPLILWTVTSNDWMQSATPESVLRNVLEGDKGVLQRGSGVVLLHDVQRVTADVLETLILQLRSEGFRFVTAGELVENKHRPENQKKNAHGLPAPVQLPTPAVHAGTVATPA